MTMDYREKIGVVIIGRNEGERLSRSVKAAVDQVAHVVYVDSGSTDGSVELACELGAETIALTEGPFTAARGRQTGLEFLLSNYEQLECIQFLDGDCIMVDDWLAVAYEYLMGHEKVAAVCGRRREEFIDRSIYNRLVDMDWVLPLGEVDNIGGGDALVRVNTLRDAGGWREELIAGEDLEFSQRMLARGWKIVRLRDEMVLHDIAMTRFSQYWLRHYRAGHAYAESAKLCAGGPGGRWTRRIVSVMLYGLVLPPLLVVAAIWYWPAAVVIAMIYTLLIARLTRMRLRVGDCFKHALAYGVIVAICKAATALGACKYYLSKLTGRKAGLIEYKTPQNAGGES